MAAEIWRKVQILELGGLIGDLHVAEQAVDLDLDLGTVAGSDLDLPVAQEAEPAFAHAASSRNVQHQITAHTGKSQRGPWSGTPAASKAASARDGDGRLLGSSWPAACFAGLPGSLRTSVSLPSIGISR